MQYKSIAKAEENLRREQITSKRRGVKQRKVVKITKVFQNLWITQNSRQHKDLIFFVTKNFLYNGRGILQFYNESGLGKYRLFVFSLVRRMTGTAPSTSYLPSPRPSTCPGSPSSSSSDSSRKISNISVTMLSICFKFFLQ